MLTWKQIKESVERGHPLHQVKEGDLLTYLIVHMDTVAFGVVGQDGFVAHTDHNVGPSDDEVAIKAVKQFIERGHSSHSSLPMRCYCKDCIEKRASYK